MASGQLRRHFADQHTLVKVEYNRASPNVCDLCSTKLTGLVGYRCGTCEFDVHENCADYFKQTVSFFAHPWHTLELTKIHTDRRCDLCLGDCPPGSFVYRCVQCGFDVHPLCTMLPQVLDCPLALGKGRHGLCMSPSSGHCGACLKELPVWHYRCGFCEFNLHIECPTSGGGGQGGDDQLAVVTVAEQGIVSAAGGTTTTSGGQGVVVRRSRSSRVALFLLRHKSVLRSTQ